MHATAAPSTGSRHSPHRLRAPERSVARRSRTSRWHRRHRGHTRRVMHRAPPPIPVDSRVAIAVEFERGVLPAERLADDQRRPVWSDHRPVGKASGCSTRRTAPSGRYGRGTRSRTDLIFEIETEVTHVGVPGDRHDHVVAEVRSNLRQVSVHDRLASGRNGHDTLGRHRDVQKGAVRHPTETRGLVVDGEFTTFAVVTDRKDACR